MFAGDLEGHALSWPHLAFLIGQTFTTIRRTRRSASLQKRNSLAATCRRTRPQRVPPEDVGRPAGKQGPRFVVAVQ